MSNWTIFSNHGHVLVCLSRDSEARLRDVAADVGLTERAVQKIVRDLQECGMISVSKHGRRNRYRIDHKMTLRHDLENNCTVGALLGLITDGDAVKAEVSSTETEVPVKSADFRPAVFKPLPEELSMDDRPVEKKAVLASEKKSKTVKADKPERQQGSLF